MQRNQVEGSILYSLSFVYSSFFVVEGFRNYHVSKAEYFYLNKIQMGAIWACWEAL